MIIYLVIEVTRKLNFFPTRGGVSKHYSPREILTGHKVEYQKQCAIQQFSYVLAHDEPQPSNTPTARAIDCIYLRPLSTQQGGHELMNLHTGKVITRRKITVAPMTKAIIQAVEQMAESQGFKGLKIQAKTGQILRS